MLTRLLQKILKPKSGSYSPDDVRDYLTKKKFDEAKRLVGRISEKLQLREAHQQSLHAEIAFHEGRDVDATNIYKEILLSFPAFSDAHYGLSLVYAESGDIQSALEHAIFANNLRPETARYLAQLGYCYMKQQSYPSAENALLSALRLDRKDKHVWNNLAIVMRAKGDPAQAKAAWLEALEIDPSFITARENMRQLDEEISIANFEVAVEKLEHENDEDKYIPPVNSQMPWLEINRLLKLGLSDEALNLAESSLPSECSESEVIAISNLYRVTADFQSASDVLASFLEVNPMNGAAWRSLAELRLAREQHDAAIQAFEKAATYGEESAEFLVKFAAALSAKERYSDALVHCARAVELDPSAPFKKRHAVTLLNCCRYEEALRIYDEMLNDKTSTINELRGNMALCYSYIGRFQDAEALIDQIIEQEVYDPAIRMVRASIHLLHGRWNAGWKDYSWRGFSRVSGIRTLPFTRWRGEALSGKSIVVLAEQGLGDQVMFASCVDDLIQQGPSRVVFEVHERVAATLRRSFPSCEVVESRQKKDLHWVKELGPMDYFVPLADLPMYFRNRDEEFPAVAYLNADPDDVVYWRSQLDSIGPGPYIGFSWKGGTEYTRTTLRTASIDHFCEMAHRHSGTWICLQYGDVGGVVEQARSKGFDCCYWPDAIKDLDKFAGLVSALDAVVTVCNTTVHFAGALGIPTIVVAPDIPEWRYGLNFEKLPWYPHVRVLRQVHPGSWGEVFDEASNELTKTIPSARKGG